MTCPGDILDGKYEVQRLLGRGGMSRVWLVRDFRLGVPWAAKEVDLEDAPGESSRRNRDALLGEAAILRGLCHPALPRVVDVVETDSSVLLVMDFVQGETLEQVMARLGGALKIPEVAGWGVELCEVLGYLHAQDPPIIHRDVKPSNVVVADDGRVRLVDFGIALVQTASSNAKAATLGTRAYAAPEQFVSGAACDARTDVYLLGATLFRIATGRLPTRANVEAVQREMKEGAGWQGDGERGLLAVLCQAMSEQKSRRYQSCAAMRLDLLPFAHADSCEVPVISAQVAEGCDECRACETGVLAGIVLARARRGLLRLAPGRRTAVVLAMGVGVVCLVAVLNLQSHEHEYQGLLDAASSASAVQVDSSPSDAERACLGAVALRPDSEEPYELLVRRVYPADARFSMSEASRWEEVASEYRASLKGLQNYGDICEEVGVLYYAFGEEDDEIKRGARAADWFCEAKEAKEDGSAKTEELQMYVTVCGFYRDLARGERDGSEAQAYRDYWEALKRLTTSDLNHNDAPELLMRLCQTVSRILRSPDHVAGLARSGISLGDARVVLDQIVRLASDGLKDEAGNSDGNSDAPREALAGMAREVVASKEDALRNLDEVYGSARAT